MTTPIRASTIRRNADRIAVFCQAGEIKVPPREQRLFAYLSPMIDCFDGLVVSWSIGTRPDAELVNTMLQAAIATVAANGDQPVVHTDRGGHYRWPGWLSRIAEAKFVRSMSRKGCSPDNAACEGFFGRLKNEPFYARNWLSTTIEEFVAALNSYIRWYNEDRIKISLGSRSPVEHRTNLQTVA